jgi:hypothetical protein
MLNSQKARWETAVCRQPLVFSIAYVDRAGMEQQCSAVPGAWGCYLRGQARILILEGLTPEQEKKVVLHELGHGLDDTVGMENNVSQMLESGYSINQIFQLLGSKRHVADGEGVMSPHIDASTEKITQKDIDLICDRIFCKCMNPE